MSRRLDDVRLTVMMLDGLEIADRTHVVALGISTGPELAAQRLEPARLRAAAHMAGRRRLAA